MLSRVAGNVYWMSRYLERAENTARIIAVHSNLLLDLPRRLALGWEPLLAITGSEEAFYQHYQIANESNVVKFLLGDERYTGSVANSLSAARENLRTTRDIIPREAWEELNNLHRSVTTRIKEGVAKRSRYEFLQMIIRSSQLIAGLLSGTMSHDTAYNFMRIGHYLERADMTTRILDVRSANLLRINDDADFTPFDNIQWMSVLKSLSAYQMYRQYVRLRVQGPDVLNFLLRNEQFPRSFVFCLKRMGYCLQYLPKNDPPLRKLVRLQRLTQSADVHALVQSGLHGFIDELQLGLSEVHDQIDTVYLSVRSEDEPLLLA